MITLTFLEYELTEKPADIFNRLKWSVEQVEVSWFDKLNNWSTSPATHKDWVGQINQKNLSFSLEEPASFFKRNFIVIVDGSVELKASTTNVKINVGLNNFSFLWICLLYLGSALFIVEAFINREIDSYFCLIFFLLAFPILGTVLVYRRIKRAEMKLDLLFA